MPPMRQTELRRFRMPLNTLFERSTTEQKAVFASDLLERYETSQNPQFLSVLSRHQATVLGLYLQGTVEASGWRCGQGSLSSAE